MTKRNLTRALALGGAIMLAGAFCFVPAAMAGRAEDNFIDADFEEAALKHFEKRFFSTIEATAEEKTSLNELFLQQLKASRPQREAIRHKMVDLADLAAAENTTDDQIRAGVAELRIMREKLQDSRLEVMLKARAQLTPEQRKTLSEKVISLVSGHGPFKRRFTSMLMQ